MVTPSRYRTCSRRLGPPVIAAPPPLSGASHRGRTRGLSRKLRTDVAGGLDAVFVSSGSWSWRRGGRRPRRRCGRCGSFAWCPPGPPRIAGRVLEPERQSCSERWSSSGLRAAARAVSRSIARCGCRRQAEQRRCPESASEPHPRGESPEPKGGMDAGASTITIERRIACAPRGSAPEPEEGSHDAELVLARQHVRGDRAPGIGAGANTVTQNTSWTIDRPGTSTTYRVTAYGDSVYAGYHGSISNVAKRAAPWVDGEYLSQLWGADIEVIRRAKSGAVASDIYNNKIVAERSYMQTTNTRVVSFEM